MFTFVLMASASLSMATALSPSDFAIESLPGLDAEVPFKQYAGYMPLDDGFGTEMFFWFVESMDDPKTDPVAFWTNGGPGSSSVAYGFWTEHGPFSWKETQAQELWYPSFTITRGNQHASIIYLEMPTGVGFSFSADGKNYENITDEQSAYESHQFLSKFFEVFSDFKKNPFYLTGESYGGHYVPNLAEKLIDEPIDDVDMRGFLIGNPGINSDWYYNVNEYAFTTFMWTHGLIPAKEYLEARHACGWEKFFTECETDFTHPTETCINATAAAISMLPQPLDFYDVLVTTCQAAAGNASSKFSTTMKLAQRQHHPFLKHMERKYGLDINGYDPCINNLTPEYMNYPEVLKAIHAHVGGGGGGRNDNVTYQKRSNHSSSGVRHWPSLPDNWQYNQGSAGEKKNIANLFPKFFAKAPEWKIWVVSGTADSAVPFLGTERWMNCLGRKNLGKYRPWLLDGDVAGMINEWDGISLVTVKGCGHTIPTYCPKEGYAFFQNYLTKE
eukprot:jgi/Bigna1/92838/estExt_fgenesh1_pm.C_800008